MQEMKVWRLESLDQSLDGCYSKTSIRFKKLFQHFLKLLSYSYYNSVVYNYLKIAGLCIVFLKF
jgi:hypothetical protein